jgi:hypothetical protein
VRTLAIGLLVVAGCHTYDPKQGFQSVVPPDQLLDYNQFVCNVQPLLVRRCSYLACHGNPDHALRIYSVGKLRLGATETREQRDTSLTADEIESNFQSAAGMVYGASPDERQAGVIQKIPLLQKPLAARFGGGEHHGVAIFPQYPAASPDVDVEWNTLVKWVGGDKQPTPPLQSCLDFFDSLGLKPRSN